MQGSFVFDSKALCLICGTTQNTLNPVNVSFTTSRCQFQRWISLLCSVKIFRLHSDAFAAPRYAHSILWRDIPESCCEHRHVDDMCQFSMLVTRHRNTSLHQHADLSRRNLTAYEIHILFVSCRFTRNTNPNTYPDRWIKVLSPWIIGHMFGPDTWKIALRTGIIWRDTHFMWIPALWERLMSLSIHCTVELAVKEPNHHQHECCSQSSYLTRASIVCNHILMFHGTPREVGG